MDQSTGEVKKPFEYKNKCEWVPDVKGFVAYVLMCSNGKRYKGYTEHFKNRMLTHFNGGGCAMTKNSPPLYIVHYESFETKREALDREKFYKSGPGFYYLKEESDLNTIKPPSDNDPA